MKALILFSLIICTFNFSNADEFGSSNYESDVEYATSWISDSENRDVISILCYSSCIETETVEHKHGRFAGVDESVFKNACENIGLTHVKPSCDQ